MLSISSPVCDSFERRCRFRSSMGDLIYLAERRAERARATAYALPAFFFDPSCPFSYLTAERVERTLGDVRWVPVAAGSLRGELGDAAVTALRERAQTRARSLRLPLVWPERFPAAAPCALRAAAHASEIGAGARFALAAGRLAFSGGFDLDDPETLAEAAAAAAVPLDDCLRAAGDTARDESLRATADALATVGILELPAIRIGERWFHGEPGLAAAGAMLSAMAIYGSPVAPVG
jgi:2-hydroxychromene-2-carboxylate isomerase